jgi:hypothetical protein
VTYPPDFLDRLRAAVRVSEIVGRKWRLRKAGAELVVADNPSFSINDKKQIWMEFGNGGNGKPGDIFAFLQTYDGFTFPEAVEEIARIAGIPIPGGKPGNGHTNGAGASRGNGASAPRRGGEDAGRNRQGSSQRVVVGQWDYLGRDGRPLYQTVRVQWRQSDGSWRLNPKTGKPEKSFYQRRRSPHVDGTWVNGLSFFDEDGEPIEYMRRGEGADWARYDDKKFREWGYTERATFAAFGNIDHTLYNLPVIIDELAEERTDQRTIFLPEGEKKVDVLQEWGLLATCNSGGAQNWSAAMAELLRDAADVVILEDNDDAGKQRTLRIAPMLLDAGCRVRSLRMPALWPDCPPKSDIVDWACNGGSRDDLLRSVERLPEWSPPPFESRYGAQAWGEHRTVPVASYEWQVKGIIPAGHNILIMGPSGSGKSFEATTLALAVARGIPYGGRRVKRAGVVYLNYEGKSGMAKRLRAYEQHHAVVDESIPFAWMTRPPGLYANEENATALAKDIKELTKSWTIPVGVIVVDTHNAATRGSSEIKTEDVSKIMERYAKVQEETGASLWIIGHTNANGEHRGNEVLANNIETTLLIEKVRDGWGKNATFQRDASGNTLRRVTVRKQREGADGISWDFVLRSVELGIDDDGDVITSMVPIHLDVGRAAGPKPRKPLTIEEKFFVLALRDANDEFGVATPAGLDVARSVTRVTRWVDFVEVYDGRSTYDRDNESETNKHRRVRQNVGKALINRQIIGIKRVADVTYIWPIKTDFREIAATAAPPPPSSLERGDDADSTTIL